MKLCNGCTLCCYLIEVVALSKDRYRLCEHGLKDGCGVHPDRPEACRKFFCRWAVEHWPEELRPDRCHVVFERLPNCATYVALVDPRHPDAIGGKAIDQKVNEIVDRGVAVLANMRHKTAIKAPKGVDTVQIISELKDAYEAYVGG
jgi:hypothetical protein